MSSKICFISPSLYRYLNPRDGEASGGAERQQYMVATELQKRGHCVSAIVGDFDQPRKETIEGINVVKGCPTQIGGPISMVSEVRGLFQAMRTVDSKIFYIRGAPRLFSVVSLFTKILNKKLIFCIANDSDVTPEYLRDRYSSTFLWVYKQALQRTETVITQTKNQQQLLNKHFGRDSIVIPNGYELPPEDQISPHSERKFVLWVGRSNKEKKKPLRYLKLARQLPDISFLMIAQPSKDGSHHRKIQHKAQSINNLKFVGTVSPNRVHKYYNQATVLVNTSDFEGFPNTYLEAWRYRTPVVALYHTVGDGFETRNMSIRSGSVSQLQSDVKRLHNNPNLRSRMGKNAREYVRENYLLTNIVTRYEGVIDET